MKINVKDLSFSYGSKNIFTGLSMTASSSDVIAIIGSNGCGKTTFLKVLSGMLTAKKGTVEFEDAKGEFPLCNAILEVPQFWSHMTGDENLRYYLGDRYNEEAISRAFDEWGIKEQKKKLVRGYSLGMKQKLGLMLMFESNVPVILLDEPTNSLDAQSIEIFYKRLKRASDEGRIIILATHIFYELDDVCTNIYKMTRNKLTDISESFGNKRYYRISFTDEKCMLSAKAKLREDEIISTSNKSFIVTNKHRVISTIIKLLVDCNIETVNMLGAAECTFLEDDN